VGNLAACYRQSVCRICSQRRQGAVISQSVREPNNPRDSVNERKPVFPSSAVPDSWRRKAAPAASLIESFYHAFRGFFIALKAERNLRIHLGTAVVVAVLALTLHVDAQGWALLTLAIGLVITAELINTALERLVDIATNNEFHRVARDAKDTAAGAVLSAAVVAALIGGFVFIPRLLLLIHR
jgi:undecaprenol kinase